MRNFPVMVGFAPEEWRNITDFLIYKQENDTHVDRTRTIQLYDAEMNIVNKFLGKVILAHAEKAEAVSEEQYGS